jgi:transcriptional regulator
LKNFIGGNLSNFKASGMGKFGGIATAGIALVEGITSLLSGDSLGTALGKAAGPALGAIIGTALLGPIGGMIGSWIGQQKAVVQGLGNIFTDLGHTINSIGGFLVRLGKDINWIIGKIFGLGDNFDLLKAVMKSLELVFYGLRDAAISLHLQYLRTTGRGGSQEAKALELELMKTRFEKEQREMQSQREDAGRTPTQQVDVLRRDLANARAELDARKSNPQATPEQLAYTQYQIKYFEGQIKSLEDKLKNPKGGTTPVSPLFAPTQTPGKPGAPATPATTQQATQVATNISNLDKKAAEQIKKTTETTKAVKDLTTKLTSQNSLQATVTSIYNLLASGSLRVMGAPGPMAPGGYYGNNGFTTLPNIVPPTPKEDNGLLVDYRTGYSDLGSSSIGSGFWKGGDVSVNAPINIHQQPGQDSKELAAMVAWEIQQAMESTDPLFG